MLEILAPAGTLECANAAIDNGADAIYLGLSAFSARQGAGNFDEPSFRAIVQKAHFCGAKIYVAMNTLVKDEELDDFLRSLLFAWNEGADAIIMQDVFLGKAVHERYPQIVLHLSTQAGVCTLDGARLAANYGFTRVILARETPILEIQKIAEFIETEVFVQGALCTCFSGQCYFSSFAGGNSGNRGRCKQPCRKKYAYDRNGNTDKDYALSLSDLSVGDDIAKLIAAGVTSFKIEGRMRRPEYVAAAVRYYRNILDGATNNDVALSDLRRTYNRGNYTKGLAFGQDRRLLSPAVQGHLGEKVGVVKVVGGKYTVDSRFSPRSGDAFKILRDGKEIGGATYLKTEGRAFVIGSKVRLKNGDGVFITTDTAVNERVLSGQKRVPISVSLYFHEGEYPVVESEGVRCCGDNALQTAKNQPLTIEDLRACFLKTDGLPVDVTFKNIHLKGEIFIPKAELNSLRRSLYSAVYEAKTKVENALYEYQPFAIEGTSGKNEKTAVIATDFSGVETDIAIYKADDYAAPIPESFKNGNFEKYLFYPAFTTEQDLLAFADRLRECEIDGIYAENYGGITFANEHGLRVFAGTGFNLTNALSVMTLLQENNVAYYALSKELNGEELSALSGERAFTLASGGIKIMDLCYCPFGKTCCQCDQKSVYSLTDEGGRTFPVRRYTAADGACRFEVYNCADLIGVGVKNVGKLLDLTLVADKQSAIGAKDSESDQKKMYKKYTSGHLKRGVL
ncbi:MAG: U32 family peptidase [Clostridia bacterium]|nr:U32 family peptidase [Clostridia bacterium]